MAVQIRWFRAHMWELAYAPMCDINLCAQALATGCMTICCVGTCAQQGCLEMLGLGNIVCLL